ncbi:uncharacterized protein LOC133848764 [Drosophila sulfurigaster albostrigata]|uniref:uncharacterized protein LOC133848764 n=1 Tax=Drosophila sulfurigaster albostrigata TaxID=89887 RepID=UPI002D21EA78|nr:uncharacterized protein LOC133848764 [Drosophila sulfurigaster albostrigata]
MNVKKRPRLELATAATTTTTPTPLTTTATTTTDVALYGNVNGNLSSTTNGLFLTSSVVGGMGMGMGMGDGAQIYLTICGDDDNSNESQEFYAIESIKQEPDLDALHAAHCMLPTNLQLPTGCEIYLVKDNTTATAAATTIAATTTTTTANKINHSSHNNEHLASIKLEPDSTNVLFMSGGGGGGGNNNNSSNGNLIVANKDTAAVAPSVGGNYNVKLDAYKKRDDKRRATHNEVERRRRDKINCWIFKLKEMLPTDGNRYKPTTNSMADSLETTTTTATATASPTTTSSSSSVKSNPNANGSANGRTPPNDSKSQILIKACDYIKSMQNEIDNLRDCLREAESLRLSNQALRDELQHLKQQQELQERFNTAGGSFNVTLNSLNSSATSDLFDGIDTAPNLSTVSSINFTKRGLIIADYDE